MLSLRKSPWSHYPPQCAEAVFVLLQDHYKGNLEQAAREAREYLYAWQKREAEQSVSMEQPELPEIQANCPRCGSRLRGAYMPLCEIRRSGVLWLVYCSSASCRYYDEGRADKPFPGGF